MTQGRPFSPDTRAAVVAAILAGASVTETARRFKINPSTASRWAAANATLATVKQRDHDPSTIVELLYDLVAQHVITMNAQLEHLADVGYLQQQRIDGIGEMFEVEGNVLLRLLAGMSPLRSDPADEGQDAD